MNNGWTDDCRMLSITLQWVGRQPERGCMGKEDIMGKSFFADRERFAELFNRCLYQGERIILPENLLRMERRYPSLTGVSGEKNRDILMEDMSSHICYGLELETESDYSMPERVMTYDVCEYEQQIREIHKIHLDKKEYRDYREKKSRMKESDLLHPAVTVVLYLGEGHWEGRRRLSDMFRITDRDRSLLGANLQDYDFPLLEADFINAEDYRTDLKEFFQAMQCRKDRNRLRQLLRSESFQDLKPETERMIAAHLHVKELVHKMEKEGLPMCKAFDELMKEERQSGRIEGRREGMREGRKAGRKQEKIFIIRQMVQEGLDETLISRMTKCSKEELAAAIGR